MAILSLQNLEKLKLNNPSNFSGQVIRQTPQKNVFDATIDKISSGIQDFIGEYTNLPTERERLLASSGVSQDTKQQAFHLYLMNDIKKQPSPLGLKELAQSHLDDVANITIGFISPIKKPVKNVVKITESLTPVEKVIQALKETKPIRGTQETLYTAERAKRFAAAKGIGQQTKGQAGFFAELSKLKGDLPKVQFESLKGKINQENVDNLFDEITSSPRLSYLETFSARTGLSKLFGETGGTIPTKGELDLLNKVFPKEFTQTLLEKRPLLQKIKDLGIELANVPRSIMSSTDLSFGGRQGWFAAPSFPKEFISSFRQQFSNLSSEKIYQINQDVIKKNPLFDLAKESGLSFTDLGMSLSQREEQFQSNLAERIPAIGKVVRASGRAYTGFANKFRMDIFQSMVKNADKAGLNPMENRDLTKSIAEFVNNATGRGKLPKALERSSIVLNSFFFSPKLATSRLNLMNPIYYVQQPPFVRKQAFKSLLAFTGLVGGILATAKLAGAKVGEDSNSSDFAKIKIGPTRIDVGAGFQQYIRSASQLISGKYVSSTTGKEITLGEGYKPLTRLDILTRQIEAKEAPIFSFITTLLKGQDFIGQPVNIQNEVAQRFIPMVIQDAIDMSKYNPDLLPLSALGAFGIGVQTYQQDKKKTGKYLSL